MGDNPSRGEVKEDGEGIYTDTAEQAMADGPPGTKIWLSEERRDKRGAYFEATKRPDGSVKLTKFHEDD